MNDTIYNDYDNLWSRILQAGIYHVILLRHHDPRRATVVWWDWSQASGSLGFKIRSPRVLPVVCDSDFQADWWGWLLGGGGAVDARSPPHPSPPYMKQSVHQDLYLSTVCVIKRRIKSLLSSYSQQWSIWTLQTVKTTRTNRWKQIFVKPNNKFVF